MIVWIFYDRVRIDKPFLPPSLSCYSFILLHVTLLLLLCFFSSCSFVSLFFVCVCVVCYQNGALRSHQFFFFLLLSSLSLARTQIHTTQTELATLCCVLTKGDPSQTLTSSQACSGAVWWIRSLSLSHSLRHLSLSQLSFLFRFYFTLCLAVGGVPSRWSGLKLTLPPHPMHTETAAPVSAHCVWYRIDRIDGRSRLPSVSLSCAEPQTTCRDASLNLRWKPYMAIDTADEKSYPPNKVTFVRGYIAYTRLKYTYVLKIKTRRCCYPRYLTWSSWRKSSFSGGQKRDKSTSKVDECRPTFSTKLSLNVSGETMFSSCCAKLVIE